MPPMQKVDFKFEIGLRGIHLYPLVYTLTVYKKITHTFKVKTSLLLFHKNVPSKF